MNKPTFIYFMYSHKWNAVKIGCSVSPRMRAICLGCVTPEQLGFLGIVRGTPAKERALHLYFYASHLSGEWFTLTPHVASALRIITELRYVPKNMLKEGRALDGNGIWKKMRDKQLPRDTAESISGLKIFWSNSRRGSPGARA